MTPLTAYEGLCHCRAIGFRYFTSLAPESWTLRACQCTFCRTHAALATSDPGGLVDFFATDPSRLHRYRFGRKITDFLLCRNCGAYVGATMESADKSFGIVNARVLHSLVDRLPVPTPMRYDDEGASERTARRESRWTPLGVPTL
jgi:hypothetical protein